MGEAVSSLLYMIFIRLKIPDKPPTPPHSTASLPRPHTKLAVVNCFCQHPGISVHSHSKKAFQVGKLHQQSMGPVLTNS